jgi:hypothetical protein
MNAPTSHIYGVTSFMDDPFTKDGSSTGAALYYWLVMELTSQSTDYGRPMKPFFIEILNFWANGQINSVAFGVFSAKLSAPILVQ